MHEHRLDNGDAPVNEIGKKDGSIGLQLFQERMKGDVHAVRIVQTKPHIEDFDANNALVDELGAGHRFGTPQRELINTAGFKGLVTIFGDITRHRDIIAAMGYRYSKDTQEDKDKVKTTIRFEYPSVGRLNEFVTSAFPNGDSIQYEEYQGGHYSAEDFVNALVNKKKILVASTQPYQLHEHAALHVFGWLGLGGEFLKYITPRYNSLLRRMEAEAALPEVPNLDNPRVSLFYRPSLEVLRNGMSNLDLLSFNIGENLLLESRNTLPVLEREERNIESSFSFGSIDTRIPQNALGDLDFQTGTKLAADVLERYARVQGFLRQKTKAATL